MTTYQFHFPASSDATLTIALPEALRGEPLNVVVAKESAKTKDVEISVDDFLRKYTGILKNCDIESVEAMKEDRINYLLEKYK